MYGINEMSAEEDFDQYIDSMSERLGKVRLRKEAQNSYHVEFEDILKLIAALFSNLI